MANSPTERLKKQMTFALEADKMKNITRQTYIADGSRKENDAEHSWHMALMALLLSEHSDRELDETKLLKMTLIHDLVEIYAGDTYAYDKKGHEDKAQREIEAARRLFSILPTDQGSELYRLWQEFEEGETPEAAFARAMDNLQPIMLNNATKGKSWQEHKATLADIQNRQKTTAKASKALMDYTTESYITPNAEKGIIK